MDEIMNRETIGRLIFLAWSNLCFFIGYYLGKHQ